MGKDAGHRHIASGEQATINVVDLHSGVVVFAYEVSKANAFHGKQSAAEACAKHLNEWMKGR